MTAPTQDGNRVPQGRETMTARGQIKVHESKADAIRDALSCLQRAGHAQGDLTVSDVIDFAEVGEAKLNALGVPVGKRAGAMFECSLICGAAAKSHRYARKGTVATLRRGAEDWFLAFVGAFVERRPFWPQQKRIERLLLTREQDEAAVAALRTGYGFVGDWQAEETRRSETAA